MGDLYSIIKPADIRKYVQVDRLDAEMCLHLAQDLYYLIDVMNKYHFGKIPKREYERHFKGYVDLHQMWDNALSAVARLRKIEPNLLSKVPTAFLPEGRFFDHPSTWTKSSLKND